MQTRVVFRHALIGAASVLLAPVAFAQDDYATFYEDGYFSGYSFTLRDSEPNFGRSGLMNDKASSVRLQGRWMLCSDGNYGGRCVEVSSNTSDLGTYRLNDALSSARYLGPIAPKVVAPPPPTVPVAVQREMLQRKIGDAMSANDLPGALKLFGEYRALPGQAAPKMLVMEAKVSLATGNKPRAVQALTQYFNQADDSDPDYSQALDLFELANKQ